MLDFLAFLHWLSSHQAVQKFNRHMNKFVDSTQRPLNGWHFHPVCVWVCSCEIRVMRLKHRFSVFLFFFIDPFSRKVKWWCNFTPMSIHKGSNIYLTQLNNVSVTWNWIFTTCCSSEEAYTFLWLHRVYFYLTDTFFCEMCLVMHVSVSQY